MLFRPSQKLAKKLRIATLKPEPADPNPFADWSAHVFTVVRTQYLILTNTSTLYSTVMNGRGVTDSRQFAERAASAIRDLLMADRREFIYERYLAPAANAVRYASAMNRSVTGSMNDLIYAAKMRLADGWPPAAIGLDLNETPMSYLVDVYFPKRALDLLAANVSNGAGSPLAPTANDQP